MRALYKFRAGAGDALRRRVREDFEAPGVARTERYDMVLYCPAWCVTHVLSVTRRTDRTAPTITRTIPPRPPGIDGIAADALMTRLALSSVAALTARPPTIVTKGIPHPRVGRHTRSNPNKQSRLSYSAQSGMRIASSRFMPGNGKQPQPKKPRTDDMRPGRSGSPQRSKSNSSSSSGGARRRKVQTPMSISFLLNETNAPPPPPSALRQSAQRASSLPPPPPPPMPPARSGGAGPSSASAVPADVSSDPRWCSHCNRRFARACLLPPKFDGRFSPPSATLTSPSFLVFCGRGGRFEEAHQMCRAQAETLQVRQLSKSVWGALQLDQAHSSRAVRPMAVSHVRQHSRRRRRG
jgi:hypothetical protein